MKGFYLTALKEQIVGLSQILPSKNFSAWPDFKWAIWFLVNFGLYSKQNTEDKIIFRSHFKHGKFS